MNMSFTNLRSLPPVSTILQPLSELVEEGLVSTAAPAVPVGALKGSNGQLGQGP